MVLTPRAVDALSIPVITAGGVCDGRTMAAALMLGAEGVYMGSRFFLSKECPASAEVKAEVTKYGELETYIGLRPYRNSTRLVKNDIAVQLAEKEKAGAEFKDVADLVAGYRTHGFVDNSRAFQDGSLCIGECVGNINDVLSAAEIVEKTMSECAERLKPLHISGDIAMDMYEQKKYDFVHKGKIPYLNMAGVVPEVVEKNHVRFRLPVEPTHMNHVGIVYAGSYFVVARARVPP